MLDHSLIHLGGAWRLCHDRLQWVLSVADNAPKPPQGRALGTAGARLRPVAFIASTKAVLRRCIHEHEIELTPEASAYLDAMPDTFRAWYQRHKRRGVPFRERAAA